MVAKRKKASKTHAIVHAMVVGCASLAIVGCIGFGIASAQDGPDEDAAFGVEKVSTASTEAAETSALSVEDVARDDSVLTSSAQRDISQGITDIEAEEEAARIAAEEAARREAAEREAAEAAAKADQADQVASSLSDVDWSVGREAFIVEWGARIDNYLAGSPLADQGVTFATAAWDYKVDPRWSPAISNTESSKGACCFLPHNAWGWGSSSWSSWEQAIDAHVAGLARVYGYSITYANAKKYCPPNYDHWYSATLSEMRKI